MKQLRPYQSETIDNLRQTIRQGVRRVVVQLPTGAGKTIVAAEIISLAREKAKRVAFVCPAISLIDQTVESFWDHGIRDVGVVQASHHLTDYSKPVLVCSIQTLQSRKFYPDCQLVIFDEIHRMFETHKRWLTDDAWREVPMIGLSATPWTRGLGKYFESLLVAATTEELIRQGYLSKFKVFATGHPDLSEVKMVAGDYHEGQLSEAMQKGTLTGDIIRTWKEKWGQGKTLCFGVDKLHAKSIQERFLHAGVSCGYQDAETTPIERREIRRKFHNGEYQVVSNIQTLTTGVDWDVRCLILARPTHSEMLYVQIIGRALRTAPGKEYSLILDHTGTTQKLGFVTEVHHEQLSNGKPLTKDSRPRKTPLPKECQKCSALKPRTTIKCPNCGHEEKFESSLMERDGQLVELNGSSGKSKIIGKKFELSPMDKAKFLAELKALGIQRGYKSGWAAQKYKSRVGVWPNHMIADIPPAKIVSPDTALWVRAEAVRWAKSQKSHAQ